VGCEVCDGGAGLIRGACAVRTYREYKLCVRPINKACRRGVQLVYDHQTALRLYRLKMDFICSKRNRRRKFLVDFNLLPLWWIRHLASSSGGLWANWSRLKNNYTQCTKMLSRSAWLHSLPQWPWAVAEGTAPRPPTTAYYPSKPTSSRCNHDIVWNVDYTL